MNCNKFCSQILLFFFMGGILSAQSPFPFGSIPMSDMEMTEYSRDKEAAAVYLFDWGEAKIDPIADKPLFVKRHFRIKILKPQGLDQATIKLRYYSSRIPNLKASTFNLENGKIVEITVNKKDIFVEKRSGNSYTISFAFNNVKVGSVIECSYTANYGTIFQLYPWAFQHEIPVALSEYTAIFPGVFQYKYGLYKNNLPISMVSTRADVSFYNVRTQEITQKYTGVNLPAFEPEPFMASKSDQLARVEYELSRVDLPNYAKNVTPTYSELSKELLDDEDFGRPLARSGFLDKKVKEITKGVTSDIEKIKCIRKYIADNVKWNEETGIYLSYPSLKKVLNRQNGSSADINLLLIAMLRKAGISAHPVVLSTRENGKLSPVYAIITKFDYVVAYVRLDGKDYLVDATDVNRPFNQLPFECLNGDGRIIHEKAGDWIPLSNKETEYNQVTLNVSVGNDESLHGDVRRVFNSLSAHTMRGLISSLGQEGYLEIVKRLNGNCEFSDIKFENIDTIDRPLILTYSLKTYDAIQYTGDLCIINPVLFFEKGENPFSSVERKFPIDYGSPEEEVYTLNFKIPEGYTVDEIPSSVSIKLPNDDAVFNYYAEQKGDQLTVMYRYKRKQTYFEAENYANLREFFNKIIKKQSDLIILKKNDSTVPDTITNS